MSKVDFEKLKKGYATPLSGGKLYGEALLVPSHIYAKFIHDLFKKKIEIHYMVNITGHGFRKLMRATKPFTYEINFVPKPHPIFDFIQEHSGNSDEEMYGNFNMGAGFTIYLPAKYVKNVITIAKRHKLKAWKAGVVKKGPKKVVIVPKNITFSEDTLGVR